MPVDERYRRQVALLVRTLPFIAEEPCFALKGGTAINLFIRDLPRLSVDIDLTYLPVAGWEESLRDVDATLRRIGGRIEASVATARVQPVTLRGENAVNKLFVRERALNVSSPRTWTALRFGHRRCTSATRMNGEAVSCTARHGVLYRHS